MIAERHGVPDGLRAKPPPFISGTCSNRAAREMLNRLIGALSRGPAAELRPGETMRWEQLGKHPNAHDAGSPNQRSAQGGEPGSRRAASGS